MLSLIPRESTRSRTVCVFLIGILLIISIQTGSRYHRLRRRHRDKHESRSANSDLVLLAALSPDMSTWATSVEQAVGKHTTPQEQVDYVETENNFTITQQQRSLHIVYRLSRFSGSGRGASRVSHLLVSLIGILGMFSAIVGALIGPWLADTTEDSADDDRFAYWVREEEDEEDDERICGFAREEKYGMHRILDVP